MIAYMKLNFCFESIRTISPLNTLTISLVVAYESRLGSSEALVLETVTMVTGNACLVDGDFEKESRDQENRVCNDNVLSALGKYTAQIHLFIRTVMELLAGDSELFVISRSVLTQNCRPQMLGRTAMPWDKYYFTEHNHQEENRQEIQILGAFGWGIKGGATPSNTK